MLGRETEPDISCEWNPKISIISESASKRVHSKRIPKFSKTFAGIFTVPFNKISDRKSLNFWSNGKRPWYGNFRRKIPENPELVEFPRSEPFNRKLWKFRDENQMERLFPGKDFRKFEYTPRGWPLFRKFCKFAICYSALVVFAAIAASWTPRARTRIRKWKYLRIIPLICR